ncbi:MAG: MTAP family purine nucleoside phosphorylase [Mycetocola sp.]
MTEATASVAVIGGSGLYSLFDADQSERHTVQTPYGTAEVTLGEIGGRRTAFLTRHGVTHATAPHLINYRANIWALASLGVKAILSSAAVGGVNPGYAPGSLVLTDQYIDRTSGRADTFYDEGSVQHLASSEPFCPTLHAIAGDALDELGESVTKTGTVVVIQGPRFSTNAEVAWFRTIGADTVNMTLYPEVPLAAELNIGTVNLSYITDGDAGDDGEEVSAGLVFRRLAEAQPRIIAAIEAIIRALPDDYAARELIDPAEVDAVLARGVRS